MNERIWVAKISSCSSCLDRDAYLLVIQWRDGCWGGGRTLFVGDLILLMYLLMRLCSVHY